MGLGERGGGDGCATGGVIDVSNSRLMSAGRSGKVGKFEYSSMGAISRGGCW